MRAITNGTTYLKDGKPLDGYLKVFKHGTTTLATIYDSTGAAITNPQAVADGKPAHQVFANESVDIVLLDEDLARVDSWVDLLVNPSVDVSSIATVANVATMKALSVVAGTSVVLQGYNSAGDKPSRIYTLIVDSTLSDDGGLILASTTVTNGFWVSQKGGVTDVRDYGIFAPNTNPFPNISGIRWYFPYVSSAARTYSIDGAAIHNAIIDPNVNLQANTTRAYLYDTCLDSVTVTGYITIVADQVKTSSSTSSGIVLAPRKELFVDSVYQDDALSLSGINVHFSVAQTASQTWTFTNCTFSGVAFMGSTGTYTYNKCAISESMLASSFSWSNATFNDCTCIRDKFTTAKNWFYAQWNIQGNKVDMNNMTLADNVNINGDLELSNCELTGTLTQSNGNLVATNVKFTQAITAVSSNRFTNCKFNALLTIGVVNSQINDLQISGCTISNGIQIGSSSDTNIFLYKFVIQDCYIQGAVTRSGTYASANGSYYFRRNTMYSSNVDLNNDIRNTNIVARSLGNTEWEFPVTGSFQLKVPVRECFGYTFGEDSNTNEYGYNAIQTKVYAYYIPAGLPNQRERIYNGDDSGFDESSTFLNDTGNYYENETKTWNETITFKTSSGNVLSTYIANAHSCPSSCSGYYYVTAKLIPTHV